MATIIDVTAEELRSRETRLSLFQQGAIGVRWHWMQPDEQLECWPHACWTSRRLAGDTVGRAVWGPGEVTDCVTCALRVEHGETPRRTG